LTNLLKIRKMLRINKKGDPEGPPKVESDYRFLVVVVHHLVTVWRMKASTISALDDCKIETAIRHLLLFLLVLTG